MKKLIIGFSRPHKWKPYAEAIMYRDKSNFSHTYSRFISSSWNTSFIYQSAGHQTHFLGEDWFKQINLIVEEYEIEIPDEVEAKIGRLCVSREGKPYAVKQVLGIALVFLIEIMSLGKIKLHNPWADKDASTTCLEEVCKLLELGLGIKCPLNPDEISVKPFHDWLITLPNVKKLTNK